jgi:alkanesulfonate monooxygenase SsuD/methylene tetrahydromethanopterin reductase-like flavin-dependent oxidoreductase (luciferase family)
MRYGIEVVTLGPYADPHRVVELAVEAERAGFELVAVWDHLAFAWGVPSADPLITLAAVAQATSTIRLLPAVTPLPRHRPHVLAWQLACLDVLSDGRLVFGAGLGGVATEFSAFGEPASSLVRAEMTDEALDVISRLWAGDTVDHAGRHYSVRGVNLAPLPVQRPRPPIWIGGESAGAIRRAARWDGWLAPGAVDESGNVVRTPGRVAGLVGQVRAAGARVGEGFDVIVDGVTHGAGASDPAAYAAAGAGWWLEVLSPSFGDEQEMLRRVRAGPPGG